MRNASTKNGSFDLVTTAIEEIGDFAEAGLLRPLDDYVDKYQPSWNDPKYGYAGGEPTVNLFTKYKGTTYVVAFDNDTQPYFYRGDLLDNPRGEGGVRGQVRPAAAPAGDVGRAGRGRRVLHAADQQLYGDVATHAPFWGIVNWNERFVSRREPEQVYFKPTGRPTSTTRRYPGVRGAPEVARVVTSRAALEKDWLAQYQLLGAGNGFGRLVPEPDEARAGEPDLDTAASASTSGRTSMPGRVVDGVLIRRPVIFYNICYGVNAFADPAHHEAAYLFLQWAGGARVYTCLTFNPGGYQDPHHIFSFTIRT